MDTNVEYKENCEYQKLKSLAIKLKRELDASKLKIKDLEQQAEEKKDTYIQSFDQKDSDLINIFNSLLFSCNHSSPSTEISNGIEDISLESSNSPNSNETHEEICHVCLNKLLLEFKVIKELVLNKNIKETSDNYVLMGETLEKLKDKIQVSELDNQRLKEEKDKLSGQVLRLHKAIGMTEDNKELIKAKDLEIEGFEKCVTNLRTQIEDRDGKIAELAERSKADQETLSQMELEIGNFKVEREASSNFILELNERIQEREDSLSKVKEEITTILSENVRLGQLLEASRKELNNSVAQSDQDKVSITQRLEALDFENRKLSGLLEVVSEKEAKASENLYRLTLELNKCREEHETYKAKVHQVLRAKVPKGDATTQTDLPPLEKAAESCVDCETYKEEISRANEDRKLSEGTINDLVRERDRNRRKMSSEKRVLRQLLSTHDARITHTLDALSASQDKAHCRLESFQKVLNNFTQHVHQNVHGRIGHSVLPRDNEPAHTNVDGNRPPSTPKFRDDPYHIIPDHRPDPKSRVNSDHHAVPTTEINGQVPDVRKKHGRQMIPVDRRKRSLDRLIGEWLEQTEVAEPLENCTEVTLPPPSARLSRDITRVSRDTGCEFSETPSAAEEVWANRCKAYQVQVCHLKDLVSENESQVCRLSEQVNLLKREIRKLDAETSPPHQKDTGPNRGSHGSSSTNGDDDSNYRHNLEYLKNVLYKFFCPETDNQQRRALVPVICTILTLSPPQSNALKQIADCKSFFNADQPFQQIHPQAQASHNYNLTSLIPSTFTSFIKR